MLQPAASSAIIGAAAENSLFISSSCAPSDERPVTMTGSVQRSQSRIYTTAITLQRAAYCSSSSRLRTRIQLCTNWLFPSWAHSSAAAQRLWSRERSPVETVIQHRAAPVSRCRVIAYLACSRRRPTTTISASGRDCCSSAGGSTADALIGSDAIAVNIGSSDSKSGTAVPISFQALVRSRACLKAQRRKAAQRRASPPLASHRRRSNCRGKG